VGPSVRLSKSKKKKKTARLSSGPKRCWAGSRPNQARLGFTGQLGLRLSRLARVLGLASCAGQLGLTGWPMVHSPLSLSVTTRAQEAAPHASPDRRGQPVGLPPDLVWLPDPVWLSLGSPRVRVSPRASSVCLRECPRGLAAM
jgi:hypothetical protein